MFRQTKKGESVFGKLRNSQAGASAVEFALLAPLFFVMFFGVLQVGMYLQNYNAVQSLASDAGRFVMIESQKDNKLSDEQVRSILLGLSTNSPYFLNSDQLEITVDRTGASRVTGATEIDIQLRYTLSNFLPGIQLPLTVISYSRSVWVVTA